MDACLHTSTNIIEILDHFITYIWPNLTNRVIIVDFRAFFSLNYAFAPKISIVIYFRGKKDYEQFKFSFYLSFLLVQRGDLCIGVSMIQKPHIGFKILPCGWEITFRCIMRRFYIKYPERQRQRVKENETFVVDTFYRARKKKNNIGHLLHFLCTTQFSNIRAHRYKLWIATLQLLFFNNKIQRDVKFVRITVNTGMNFSCVGKKVFCWNSKTISYNTNSEEETFAGG